MTLASTCSNRYHVTTIRIRIKIRSQPLLFYELIKIAPLPVSPQLFHSKLKTLLFNKSYPDSSSSPTFLPVSIPNTIHHSRLTFCLPDSGSDPLPIDFILDKRRRISWFPRLRFCGRIYSASSSGTTQKRSQPQRGRIMLF